MADAAPKPTAPEFVPEGMTYDPAPVSGGPKTGPVPSRNFIPTPDIFGTLTSKSFWQGELDPFIAVEQGLSHLEEHLPSSVQDAIDAPARAAGVYQSAQSIDDAVRQRERKILDDRTAARAKEGKAGVPNNFDVERLAGQIVNPINLIPGLFEVTKGAELAPAAATAARPLLQSVVTGAGQLAKNAAAGGAYAASTIPVTDTDYGKGLTGNIALGATLPVLLQGLGAGGMAGLKGILKMIGADMTPIAKAAQKISSTMPREQAEALAKELEAAGITPQMIDAATPETILAIQKAGHLTPDAKRQLETYVRTEARTTGAKTKERIVSESPHANQGYAQRRQILSDENKQLSTQEYSAPYSVAVPLTERVFTIFNNPTLRPAISSAEEQAISEQALPSGAEMLADLQRLKLFTAKMDEYEAGMADYIAGGRPTRPVKPAWPKVSARTIDRIHTNAREDAWNLVTAGKKQTARGLYKLSDELDSMLDNIDSLRPARENYRDRMAGMRLYDEADTLVKGLFGDPKDFPTIVSGILNTGKPITAAQKNELTHVILTQLGEQAGMDNAGAALIRKRFAEGTTQAQVNLSKVLGSSRAKKVIAALEGYDQRLRNIHETVLGGREGNSRYASILETLENFKVPALAVGLNHAHLGTMLYLSKIAKQANTKLTKTEADEITNFMLSKRGVSETFDEIERVIKTGKYPDGLPPSVKSWFERVRKAIPKGSLTRPTVLTGEQFRAKEAPPLPVIAPAPQQDAEFVPEGMSSEPAPASQPSIPSGSGVSLQNESGEPLGQGWPQ